MSTVAPPDHSDVVVIGAGMGGLTAAACLAKAGLRVCVLEMDARPGGYLAGYERRGFIFDTAIHWLNQCGEGGLVRRALDFVGPDSPRTPSLGDVRRYRGDSFDYLLTDDPDELAAKLAADHPGQAKGIQEFFAAAKGIGEVFRDMSRGFRSLETMSGWQKARYGASMAKVGLAFMKYNGPTHAGLEKHFRAGALSKVFCSEERLLSCLVPVGWAYSRDYQAPPAGGSREFPRFLAAKTRAFGGATVFKARAERIHLDGPRVAAVEFVRGMKNPSRHTVCCKYVLAACDVETVYERMLAPSAIEPKVKERLRTADIYDSCLTVSVALDVPAQQLGFGEELIMLTRDDVSRKDHNAGDPHKAAISILAPSVRDASMTPAGKGCLTLLTTAKIDYADRWKTGPGDARGPEYVEFKNAYAQILLDRVQARVAPDLLEHIEFFEVATPLTHRRYTGNRDGSIMAAKPTRPNIKAKVAQYITPVENLILAGHWAEYGGGVPVAVRAGVNAALIVLSRERKKAFVQLAEIADGKRAPDDIDPALFEST